MLLERECVLEEPIIGGNVKISLLPRLYSFTANDWFPSDTSSLQEDLYPIGEKMYPRGPKRRRLRYQAYG